MVQIEVFKFWLRRPVGAPPLFEKSSFEDFQKGGGGTYGHLASTSQNLKFSGFLAPEGVVGHFYSTLRTCLALVGIVDPPTTAKIPQK